MGIRFFCPHCDRRLHVKEFLAGRKGICPHCDEGITIPAESTLGVEAGDQADPESAPPPSRSPDAAGSSRTETRETPSRASRAAAPVAPIDESASTSDVAIDLVTFNDPTDPIDAAPHLLWYVRPSGGGQYGPAEGTILKRWLAEGRVGDDTLVWQEGWEEWREAREVFSSVADQRTNPATTSPPPVPAQSSESPRRGAPRAAAKGTVRSRSSESTHADWGSADDRDLVAPLDPAKGKLLDYRLRRTRDRGRQWAAVIVLALLCIGLAVALGVVLTRGL